MVMMRGSFSSSFPVHNMKFHISGEKEKKDGSFVLKGQT